MDEKRRNKRLDLEVSVEMERLDKDEVDKRKTAVESGTY